MKKIVAIFILAVLLLILISGCKKSRNFSTEVTSHSVTETTIAFIQETEQEITVDIEQTMPAQHEDAPEKNMQPTICETPEDTQNTDTRAVQTEETVGVIVPVTKPSWFDLGTILPDDEI